MKSEPKVTVIMRSKLKKWIEANVKDIEHGNILSSTEDLLKNCVNEFVSKACPEKEMDILHKYGKLDSRATPQVDFYMKRPEHKWGYNEYVAVTGHEIPQNFGVDTTNPSKHHWWNSNLALLLERITALLYSRMDLREATLKKNQEAKNIFLKVVATSVTLEDLFSFWPESREILNMAPTLLPAPTSILNDEEKAVLIKLREAMKENKDG